MLGKFLNFIEIKTKITSLFAFLLALSYLFYIGQKISWHKTLIFFASMFVFDLATTAINNYIDTKSNQQRLQFKRSHALILLLLLLVISVLLGIYLVLLTDKVVLLLGGICFLTGILYTFGPIPISRLPLGEIVSGLFYGFFIPFLILYINMLEGFFFSYDWDGVSMAFYLKLNVFPVITVILLSVGPMCTTANIMLANNICDLEKDIKVKRYTLPYYIKDKALPLFVWIYYLTYFATILMVLFNMLSPLVLLSLLTFFIIKKNISRFYNLQEKGTTFSLSIKNYMIIMGSQTLLIFLSGLISF